MKIIFLFLGLAFISLNLNHAIIYHKAHSEKQISKIMDSIFQIYLRSKSLTNIYSVFQEKNNQEKAHIVGQYQKKLSQSNFVLAFSDKLQDLDFCYRAILYDVPVLLFSIYSKNFFKYQESLQIHTYQKEKYFNTHPQQLKEFEQIIENFINKNLIKKKQTPIFNLNQKILLPFLSYTNKPFKLANFSILAVIVSPQDDSQAGWWNWMKNHIDVFERFGKVTKVNLFKKQKLPYQILNTFDLFLMQSSVYQLLAQMTIQMKRRTFLGPFATNDNFSSTINIKQKQYKIIELINGTNILMKKKNNGLQECRQAVKNSLTKCHELNYGVNFDIWKPIYNKVQRKTPLVYYKQRNKQFASIPNGLVKYISNWLSNRTSYYNVVSLKMYPMQTLTQISNGFVSFTQQQIQTLLMKANFGIVFAADGTYQVFLDEFWACDVPLLTVFKYLPNRFSQQNGLDGLKVGEFMNILQWQLPIQKMNLKFSEFEQKLQKGYYNPRQQINKTLNRDNLVNQYLKEINKIINEIGYKKK